MVQAGAGVPYEHVTPPPRHRGPEPGVFFTDRFNLPEGRYAARVSLMIPPKPPPGAELSVAIRYLDAPRAVVEQGWPIDHRLSDRADDLVLEFSLPLPARLEMRASVTGPAEDVWMRAVKIQRTDRGTPPDWGSTRGSLNAWPLDRLRNVVVGISGTCPASCIHCPTNKDWLRVPRGQAMPEAIFERLVDGLAACRLPVTDAISFGLFGEPMMDRDLAQRIRRLRAVVPDTRYVINTTGAVLGPRQVEAMHEASLVAIHIESLIPETYDRIMAPLRLARVRPNIERIVGALGTRATLSLPVHRDNIAEIPAIEDWWRGMGGGEIYHQPFSNRLTMARDVLDLHLSPVTGACTQDLAYDLIIDWDGRLLTCCSDFRKQTNLGSLATATLPEIIADARRQMFQRMLRKREWQRIGVCRTCLFDDPAGMNAAMAAARTARR